MITTPVEPTIVSTKVPPALERSKSLFRAVQVIWYVLAVLEVLLAFRFVLKLLGANSSAGFTDFIYAVTLPFVLPFQAVFPASGSSGYVFEWTTLLAGAVYWLLAWGINMLLVMGRPISKVEAHEQLKQNTTL